MRPVVVALASLVFVSAAVFGQQRSARVAAVIDDLVVANRVLAAQGILPGYGHVSARNPDNPKRYFLARSLAPELVTAADIVEFDLDSNAIGAAGTVFYLERFIHGEIYRARPDVLMRNHGVAIVATSLPGVVQNCVSLEKNAQILNTLLARGDEVTYLELDGQAQGEAGGGGGGRAWELWKRQVQSGGR